MKLKSLHNKIRIRNFDRIVCDEQFMKNKKKHGNLLPNNIRCIICGQSSCGKINVIFNLLFDPNGIRFENVCFFKITINRNIC